MPTAYQRDGAEVAEDNVNDASDFDAHARNDPRTAQGAALCTSWANERAPAEIISSKKALAGSRYAVFAEAALCVGFGLHHMTGGRR